MEAIFLSSRLFMYSFSFSVSPFDQSLTLAMHYSFQAFRKINLDILRPVYEFYCLQFMEYSGNSGSIAAFVFGRLFVVVRVVVTATLARFFV
jgi:hypothetical protein